MKKQSIKISLQEFDFIRAYVDIGSPTFANAYQSCVKAGYSKNYCRVIRRNYPTIRLKLLKNALKDDGLVRVVEATRYLDFGTPIKDYEEIERIVRKKRRELIGMSAKEVISALNALLGKGV